MRRERGAVGRIILYKKGALSADVAFKALAEAEAAARKLDGTELGGRTLEQHQQAFTDNGLDSLFCLFSNVLFFFLNMFFTID